MNNEDKEISWDRLWGRNDNLYDNESILHITYYKVLSPFNIVNDHYQEHYRVTISLVYNLDVALIVFVSIDFFKGYSKNGYCWNVHNNFDSVRHLYKYCRRSVRKVKSTDSHSVNSGSVDVHNNRS